MITAERLRHFLDVKKKLLLDGALGTELQRRGISTKLPLWSAQALIDNDEVVERIHREYIEAGADIITTNTFRTQQYVLDKGDSKMTCEELTRKACDVAKRAVHLTQRNTLIAGSMAPLEDCYKPDDVPTDDVLRREHTRHARALLDCDFILAETFNLIREAEVVSSVLRELDATFMISFVVDEKGLLSGELLSDAIGAMEKYDPFGYGINCADVDVIEEHVKDLRSLTQKPIIVYSHGDGKPCDDLGWTFSDSSNESSFLTYTKKWATEGVDIIGGCCGTTPEHVRLLRAFLG